MARTDQGLEAAAEAALEIVSEDLQELLAEDPDADAVSAESTEAESEDPFVLDPVLPDEILSLLDEPEEEEEQPYLVNREDDEEEYEYDEEKATLKKQLKQAQKKNEWLESKRVDTERVKWIAEADKLFPLADVEGITATSRRGFIKEARAQHDRNRVIFEKTGAKAAETLLATARAEAEQIKATAKEDAQKAWGNSSIPLTPQAPGTPNNGETEAEAFQRGGFAAVIRNSLP